MKFSIIFVMLCILAGALCQTAAPDTTTTESPVTSTQAATGKPDCGFPGPCGKLPKGAKKLYFFF